MSTEENKALVRRFVKEVFQDLRVEAVDELVAEDFVSHTWTFEGRGKAGLRKVTARIGALVADIEFIVEDLIAEGDKVAARLTASATPIAEVHGLPPSGRRYTIGEIHIFRLAEGKLVEHWHQIDSRAMMRQLRGDSD